MSASSWCKVFRTKYKTDMQTGTNLSAMTLDKSSKSYNTQWGIISGTPSAKWHSFVITLFFCIQISTTKREIMLHAMPLKLPTSLTALPCNFCVGVTSSFFDCVCRSVGSRNNQRPFRRACCQSRWSTLPQSPSDVKTYAALYK